MKEPFALVPMELRALQARHRLTVKQMAGILEINRVNFSHVINGKSALSVGLALRIEAAFGVDARELLIAQLDDAMMAELIATRYWEKLEGRRLVKNPGLV
jgi:plasmid maintenance system antidote protein VapI